MDLHARSGKRVSGWWGPGFGSEWDRDHGFKDEHSPWHDMQMVVVGHGPGVYRLVKSADPHEPGGLLTTSEFEFLACRLDQDRVLVLPCPPEEDEAYGLWASLGGECPAPVPGRIPGRTDGDTDEVRKVFDVLAPFDERLQRRTPVLETTKILPHPNMVWALARRIVQGLRA